MSADATLSIINGTLTPCAPFDFAKTLVFLGGFTPTEGEQTLTAAAITKAVTINGRAVAFALSSVGTVDEPSIAYTLYSERALTEAEHAAIRDRISFFLSLEDDLQSFYRIGLADSHFEPIIKQLYGFHQPKFLTPFETACWAVLVQRIPMNIAHRIKMALVERWGTSITLPDGELYRAFPEPQQLAAADVDELTNIIRNTRKVEYLQAVVQFFNEVDEHFLRTGDHEEVMTKLREVRGIGQWSQFFILIRGLGRMEQTSTSDKEILKAASRVYKREMTPADVQDVLDRYVGAQGYWSFYTRASWLDSVPMVGMQ
jgi:DNA-3-methyladenine glycosylase II